jgi:hypothetical protein
VAGEDEDEDEGGGPTVAGDVEGEVEGRMEGRGGVDCKSGTNKVSRVVDSEPTVTVDAALLIAVSNMTTET